jgi:transposase InsO family protein
MDGTAAISSSGSSGFGGVVFYLVGLARDPMRRVRLCRYPNNIRHTEFNILTRKWIRVDKVEERCPKEEVRIEGCEYMEPYYNKRRRHSALGYAIPIALTHCNTA